MSLFFFGEFSKQAKNSCVVSVVVYYVSDLALFLYIFFSGKFHIFCVSYNKGVPTAFLSFKHL